jgi:hypothetical protein
MRRYFQSDEPHREIGCVRRDCQWIRERLYLPQKEDAIDEYLTERIAAF